MENRIPQSYMIPQYRTLKLKLPKYRVKKSPRPQYRKSPCPPQSLDLENEKQQQNNYNGAKST